MNSLRGLALLVCFASVLQGQGPLGELRYIHAPGVILADPEWESLGRSDGQDWRGLAPDSAWLRKIIETGFRKTLPGNHRPLARTAEDILDPSNPTLLVVPRLTAVRLSKDSVANVFDQYEATLVGDITLVDPWSLGALYSATRMAIVKVDVARDMERVALRNHIKDAFEKAAGLWVMECLEQIHHHAHPFVLKGAVLPPQTGVRVQGGLWPFGSKRGIAERQTLMGIGGRTGVVKEVFEGFSVVQDPTDPGRIFPPEQVLLKVVVLSIDDFSKREDPKVALRWSKGASLLPDPSCGPALPTNGWLGLMANYLGKGGTLRILPIPAEEASNEASQWSKIREALDQSKQVSGETSTFSASTLASDALQTPDLIVEIGLLDSFHGTVPVETGGTDHYFRAVWGVAWYECSEGDRARVFRGFQTHEQATQVRTKPGVRELDTASIWFTLCRNGLIRLAEKVRPEIKPRLGGNPQLHVAKMLPTGRLGGTQQPSSAATLTWFRPMAEVRDLRGQSLGFYGKRMGTLTLSSLGKASPNDELRYFAGGEDQPRIRMLTPEIPTNSWLMTPRWMQVTFASMLAKVAPVDFVIEEEGTAPFPLSILLRISNPSFAIEPGGIRAGAEWRVRLYRNGYRDQGQEPEWKAGVAFALPVPWSGPGQSKTPKDLSAGALLVQRLALEDLQQRSTTQGLVKALTKE